MNTLCVLRRHCTWVLIMGWYHAARFIQTWVESHIAARFVSCFLATFSIFILLSPISSAWGPLVGGSQDCVNVFTLTITDVPGRVAALIMRSVTIA